MRRFPVRTTLVLALLATAPVSAAIYENTISVDDEEDLFEMNQRGDISDATADTLLELIREGVDLNSADREQLYDLPGITYLDVDAILEYRKAKGRIEDPTELVAAGAITAEQLIQIAPFIRIDAAAPRLPIGGRVRAQGRFTTTDNVPPPALLNARVRGPWNLSAGFLMFTTRRRADTPTYDAVNDALQSKGFLYQPQLPRFFVQWKPNNFRLIAGTFTVGFGERMTLDNTRRQTPRGFYLVDDFRRPSYLSQTCKLSAAGLALDPTSGCDSADGKNLYITPDYTWRDSFRGIAASIEDLKIGEEASASAYGFLSYQSRSIYQYELYDKRYCEDPRDDNNPFCKAPSVYLPDGSTRLVFSTLNNVFDELTGGGHVTFKPTYRFTFGATAFAAVPFFKPSTIELDFQEYSRYPSGGAFGAIGLDAHASYKGFNFFIEGTHSFDKRVGTPGGGNGVEARTTFSPKGHELELSLRFYDLGFGTPYARPVSSPDETDGLRARNEAGARLRWHGRFGKDWETRFRADFWVNPYAAIDGTMPAGIPNLYALARLDFNGWNFLQPAVWVDARNRNLVSDQRGRCSSGTVVYTEGAPFTCGGDLYKFAARIDTQPFGRYLHASVQAWFTFTDDIRYKDRFRNDFMFWFELRSMPTDWLQLRARTKYLDQDISDPTYLETSVWSFIEAAWVINKGTRIAGRYDLYVYLDQRSSTLNRVPSPEHRFQLDLRASF
ncbi:MAG: helix-hairpin-helix domain-containing protein [Myxococcaceae bacterium]